MIFLFKCFKVGAPIYNQAKMAKNKGARIRITLEHKCDQGVYRYHTTKNRRNTTDRLELKKYSPVTKKHELFREIK